MTIATKNGSVILKDSSVAQNCGCCGGWYCYSPACQTTPIAVTISALSQNVATPLSLVVGSRILLSDPYSCNRWTFSDDLGPTNCNTIFSAGKRNGVFITTERDLSNAYRLSISAWDGGACQGMSAFVLYGQDQFGCPLLPASGTHATGATNGIVEFSWSLAYQS